MSGSDVDERRSILDLGEYGTAYAPAWLPFVVLVVIGYILLRRVSGRSGFRLSPPDDGPAPVPAPRTPPGS